MIRSFNKPIHPAEIGWLLATAIAVMLSLAPAMLARADEASVSIANFAFTPAALTVKPGATVTFVNHDDIPHLVVAVDGSYRSKALDTNDKFSFTFAKPGEYAYFCGLHPHMRGKIVVAP
jgi:plastocyanin